MIHLQISKVAATACNLIIAAFLVLLSIESVSSELGDDFIEVETQGSCRFEAGSRIDVAKEVALFTAKRKAIELAGRYFSRNSLINVYEIEQDEIYSLAAREVQPEILEEKQETVGTYFIYHVRIKAQIKPSDFIKAEMEDSKEEEKEANESYREEMEQYVSAAIDPGKDIAKAYRLLREKKWRIAMIYLNHLAGKYPNWDSIYMVKAITYYVLHEAVFMKKALQEACRLGNQLACNDLRDLKRVHKHDFGVEAVD
jgi:hypothetical protein